jgi:hypothetical protein
LGFEGQILQEFITGSPEEDGQSLRENPKISVYITQNDHLKKSRHTKRALTFNKM